MPKSSEQQLKEMLKGSDTRGSQYASYYTDVGWQRWNTSAAVVAQQIAENKLEFVKASSIYQKEIASIQKRRGDLDKRLSDISIKKAAAEIKREDAEWKETNTRLREQYKAETKQARDAAYVRASSYSYGYSKTYGTKTGAAVRAAGGRDALDEAMDDVGSDRGLTSKQAYGNAVSLTNDYTTGAAQLRDLKARMVSGQLDATQYGSGVTLYGAHRYMVSKLAKEKNTTEDLVELALDAALNDKGISADIAYGEQKVLDRATKGTSGSSGVTGYDYTNKDRQSGSTGSYYQPYGLPPMAPLDTKGVDLKPLEDAETEIREQIKALADEKTTLKPVLEPIDVITATRNEFMNKYGQAPTGTTLRMGGETIGKYKDLMPYELTNALGKVKTFFGNYVTAELATARTLAGERELTTDEFNAAVDLGKKKAREVLFSGLAKRDPQYAALTSTPSALAGATSVAGVVPSPTDERGWSSVGVVRGADEASYQKAKEDWARKQGMQIQTREGVLAEAQDRISRYNRDVPNPYAEIERNVSEARGAGILPEIDSAMREVNAPIASIARRRQGLEFIKDTQPEFYQSEMAKLDEEERNILKTPPRTPSEYETLFRNRVLPPAIEAETFTPTRMVPPPPELGTKPEGAIGPIPTPPIETPRSPSDILLRGFRPELDRRTGELITPQLTPQQRQDAIVGMTSGSQQASLFPESMSPSMPRTTSEGVAARPLGIGELKPTLNKLDREALGIPETPVGTEVRGNLSIEETQKEKLRRALEDAAEKQKTRLEFLRETNDKPKQGATLEQRDTKAKIEAVTAGTKLATEDPAAAGKSITKDAMGKYIAAVYDENKIKGTKAKPIGELTQTIIREYAGDSTKQKKAVEILSSLAALDTTSNKINA
jgi:hypothetical protein